MFSSRGMTVPQGFKDNYDLEMNLEIFLAQFHVRSRLFLKGQDQIFRLGA